MVRNVSATFSDRQPKSISTSSKHSGTSSAALMDCAWMQEGAPPQHDVCDLGELATLAPNWMKGLVCDHLPKEARLALFGVCQGTKRMVLEVAKHATVMLHVDPSNMAGLQAVRDAMQARGRLVTNLELSTDDSHLMSFTLGWLATGTMWLTELTLELRPAPLHLPLRLPSDEQGATSSRTPPPAVTNERFLPITILATAGRCCPNLRTLGIRSHFHALPSPALFPNLRELIIDPRERLGNPEAGSRVGTCAPYIQQLTRLTLGQHTSQSSPMAELFTPANVGNHLQTLHLTSSVLDDELLEVLLQCAPSLEELKVGQIQLENDTHGQTPTPWRRLECGGIELHLKLSSLLRLPLAPGMELVCRAALASVFFDITSEGAAALAARLQTVWYEMLQDCDEPLIVMEPGQDIGVDDEPAALRAGLNVLRSWSLSMPANLNPHIHLEFWTMTTELMLELRQLPPWGSITFEHLVWLPAPQQYSPLLRLLPDSFTRVCLDGEGMTAKLIQRICVGAPLNRSAEAPLRIEMASTCPEAWIQAIQHTMQQGPFPNVVVARIN